MNPNATEKFVAKARDETILLRKAPWEYFIPMTTKDDEISSINCRKMFGKLMIPKSRGIHRQILGRE